MNVRTRFAPSPTGYLHVGSARTALYSYLYAKRFGGQFILRIEDTDLERSTPEAVQAILEGMEWLGLSWDEGPFYQTQHFERYKQVAEQLVQEEKAYRCYCSRERLDALRENQMTQKDKPRYDGRCRHLVEEDTSKSHVIRFKNPIEGQVVIKDLVLGEVVFDNAELDDFIIARSDGTPTYNFTVVVDDWDMKITHVIRGNDHLNNTPRQINVLNALGAELPQYGHIPMIHGEDGKKLSKRHGAVSVMEYKDEGYLPHALLNYLVRLGWSHGDQEIFSLEEMIRYFDTTHIHKSPAAFSFDKLQWLNQHYLKTDSVESVAEALKWQFQQLGINISKGPSLEDMVIVQRERAKTLKEMAEKSRYFYEEFSEYDEKAAKEHLTAESKPILQALLEKLSVLPQWQKENLHDLVKQVSEEMNVKMGKVAQPLRVALTGNTISPSIDETLVLIGKEKALNRLQRAVSFIG